MTETQPQCSQNPGRSDDTAHANGRLGAEAMPDAAPHSNGRDARGRFAAGNKGGPGNPFARRVAALRQALLDALAPQDLQAIVKGLIAAAMHGDVAAARLVLAYSLGKPGPTVDPDTIDLNEWQLWQQMGADGKTMASLFSGMHVPLACEVMRAVLPTLQDLTRQQVADTLAPPTPNADLPHPAKPSSAPPEEPLPGQPPADPETNNGCAVPSEPEVQEALALNPLTDEFEVNKLIELLRQSALRHRADTHTSSEPMPGAPTGERSIEGDPGPPLPNGDLSVE